MRGREADVLERWLTEVVSTPGLTAIDDLASARAMLLDDALAALSLIATLDGPIADIGSGGGTPGIPLAASLPDRPVTLIEAERRKCAFLETLDDRASEPLRRLGSRRGATGPTPSAWSRRRHSRSRRPRSSGASRSPGRVAMWSLWVGPTADLDRAARVAALIEGEAVDAPEGLVVLRKTGPTPAGFPRRTGVARKRPLG